MCGLFGAIGRNINVNVIRTLALANAERGNEALGFFDSENRIWKRAESPLACLEGTKIQKFLAGVANGWFVAGHTRFSTRGWNNHANAHPFRYGKIVGAHNGVVDAPNKYAVDSQYLFDSLDKAGNDYQAALADVGGYWGLTWTDGEAFYIQAHNNTIAVCEYDGCFYYSSDWKHLRAATGVTSYHPFTEGETLKFYTEADGGVVYEEMPTFVSKAKTRVMFDCRTIGQSKGSGTCADPFAFEENNAALDNSELDREYREIMRGERNRKSGEFSDDEWNKYAGSMD